MKMKKLISLLGEKYVLDIMCSLDAGPKRYSRLREVCPTDPTLTKKLRKLQEAGLVGTEAMTVDGRPAIHYVLTKRGVAVLRHFEGLPGTIEDASE